ncbi:MAG: hypothetical protein ACTS1X_10750, partial [Parasphingopyxis sp.]|uniref:hypothetical protein n=1 Tax=Parasphingopyxis sp. TaxID=1920299 RepID=UPI003F9FA69A
TSAGNPERYHTGKSNNQSPAGHGLLGFQIPFGICSLIAGAYLFVNAFEQSSRLQPRTGALGIVLGAYLMLMGSLLATRPIRRYGVTHYRANCPDQKERRNKAKRA